MAEAEANLLSAKLVADLRRAIRWQQNFRVYGATFTNTPEGATLALPQQQTPRPQPAQSETCFALLGGEITPQLNGSSRKWSWTEYYIDSSGNPQPVSGGRTQTNSGYAYDYSGRWHANGQFVTLRYWPAKVGSGAFEPAWVIVAESARVLLPVTLEQDGGSDGDLSNPATYTYTATTIDGYEVGTGLSPAWQRGIGYTTPATHGTLYFGLSVATPVLWQTDEIVLPPPPPEP